MAANFTFDELKHSYYLNGVRLPSVTEIMRPIVDFSGIDPLVLARKARLGTAVHDACCVDDNDELDEDTTDPEVMCYVRGWRAFKRDAGVKVLLSEHRVYHETLNFCGTLDRLVDTRQGLRMLIDLKTAVTMGATFGVQIAAYKMLLAQAFDVSEIANKGLQLRWDGSYRLIPYNDPNDRACFAALLSIWNWKNTHGY